MASHFMQRFLPRSLLARSQFDLTYESPATKAFGVILCRNEALKVFKRFSRNLLAKTEFNVLQYLT